jgi:hypothetical protein
MRYAVCRRGEVSNQRAEVESRESRDEGRGLEGGAPISNQRAEVESRESRARRGAPISNQTSRVEGRGSRVERRGRRRSGKLKAET